MFCKECGSEIPTGAKYCKECGANIMPMNDITEKEEDSDIDNEETIMEQTNILKKHKLFHDSNEVLIDTLGSGFISSVFVQEKFSKSVLFLSDKRIYQKGKLFDKNLQGKITYYNGEKSVDIREVTGLTYYTDAPIHYFKLIVPLFLIGIAGFTMASSLRTGLKEIVSTSSICLLILALIALVAYILKNAQYIIIEYAGGAIISNCNWYSEKSTKRFIRNISLCKDNILNK